MGETNKAWADREREEGTLIDVSGPSESGWYSVTSSNGWSCAVDGAYGVVPRVGDAFVTWGSIGRPIRGQAINRHVLYYRTPAEQEMQDQAEYDARKAARIAEYEGKRTEFDARVAALPDPLRERIEGFRAFRGDGWRWEYEPYEVMCCEEAVKIRARFPTGDDVKRLGKMAYAEQKAAFPEMGDGHSGNSWSFSVRLAWLLAERPDLVPMEHGALCPLVGCEDYGCHAVGAAPSTGGTTPP